MKFVKIFLILTLVFGSALTLIACTKSGDDENNKFTQSGNDMSSENKDTGNNQTNPEPEDNKKPVPPEKITYESISAEKAKQLMDSEKNYIIIDARTENEYNGGHIKNAVLMPYDEVNSLAPSLLKDKNQLILVYCRSGNRSKKASDALVKLGYTNVKEFGGIIDWPYDVVK